MLLERGAAARKEAAHRVARAATAGQTTTPGAPVPDAAAKEPPFSRRSKNRIDQTIDLVRQPDAHVSALPPAQISALAKALGLHSALADAPPDAQAAASTARAVAERLQGPRLGDVFTKYDRIQEMQRIKDSELVKGISPDHRRLLQDLAVKTHLWLREHATVDPVAHRKKIEVSV